MKGKLIFLLIFSQVWMHPLLAQDARGDWFGWIKTDDGAARIVVSIYKSGEKEAGYMAIPEFFGPGKVAHFDSLAIQSPKVFLSWNKTLTVTATMVNDSLMQGTYQSTQPALSSAITLRKQKSYPNLKRPQTPEAPLPYSTRNVSFIDSLTGFRHQGTLTTPVPEGSKAFPAIVLFPGSSFHDRNYTAGAHETFTVLADYLTRRGYVVLRKDSRGLGGAAVNAEQITLPELVADGDAALQFLKRQPLVDTSRMGVLGHSEGGLVAPLLAANNHTVKFVVMLAAPVVPWKRILFQQVLVNQKERFKTDSLPAFLRDTSIIYKTLETANPSPRTAFLLKYNAANTLSRLTVPVLALNGDKDLQTEAQENISLIEATLRQSGNKNYKTMILPGLNHSFQTCVKCSFSENIFLEETFSPAALGIIGDWLDHLWKN